jgi:hypothetical protein
VIRTASAPALGWIAAALLTLVSASATAQNSEPARDAEHEAPGDPPGESEEGRFEALADSIETGIAVMRENGEADEVLLVEAEALSAVAHEILVEGDLETALTLLEEAIALLEIPASAD